MQASQELRAALDALEQESERLEADILTEGSAIEEARRGVEERERGLVALRALRLPASGIAVQMGVSLQVFMWGTHVFDATSGPLRVQLGFDLGPRRDRLGSHEASVPTGRRARTRSSSRITTRA